jgi:DNA polymerase-3 subunit delta
VKFDISRALSHQIVMLGGEEDSLRLSALSELIAAGSGGDDFDIEYFSGDNSTPAHWLASCGTSPFLSPRRIAVVRHLLKSDNAKDLASAKLPETSLLILVADEEYSATDDRKFVPRAAAWQKAVEKVGVVYKFTIDPKAFDGYLQQAAAESGKRLTPAAMEAFKEMTSLNLSHALSELEKVVIYVGEAPQITDQDVRELVVPSREYNVFGLIDSIMQGKAGAALDQLRVLVGNGAKLEGSAMRDVFPNLTRQLRLIWQARALIEGRGTLTSIPKSVSDQFPSHQSLLSQKDYPQRLAMRAAEKLSFDQIGQCLEVLVTTESRIKGLEPSFSTRDALEMMVLELVAAVKPRAHVH